ncbi:MAG: DUF4842 domain-containing protein [Prevotella sp.]
MKFLSKSMLMVMAAGSIIVSSCSHDQDYFDPAQEEAERKANYGSNWKNVFGNVYPEQDWNLAVSVKANIDLTGLEDAQTVRIYTGLPGGKDCRLIAEQPATKESFFFDINETATDAFVTITDSNGETILANYYTINNGIMIVAENVRGTRAGECPTTLGDKVMFYSWYNSPESYDLAGLWDSYGYWDGKYQFQNEWDHTVKYSNVFDFYQLNNVVTETGPSTKISDLIDLVGEGGTFAERAFDADGKCNLKRWYDQLKVGEGVEIIMKKDGPMHLTFAYGATEKFNRLGYIYYKEGATEAEILSAPRYLLMSDATPIKNLKRNGASFSNCMQPAYDIESYQKYGGTDYLLTGTNYKLVYFDENGKASYTFPKGTHIIFFGINGNNNSWKDLSYSGSDIRYSLPWMNRYFYYKWYENHPSYEEQDAATNFVTYMWNNKIVMAYEDEGGDDDMNDIIFFVNGSTEQTGRPDTGSPVQSQSWILACEDLGSSDDFDFNDVVFKVSHVSGQTTATVTPLAAGGKLPVTIWCNANSTPQRVGEIHTMFGYSPATMINTGDNADINGVSADPVTVTIPENYSITNDMGSFSLIVETGSAGKNNYTANLTVSAPGKGSEPQMICVPGSWKWPKERISISYAYPGFGQWGANYGNGTWYNSYTPDSVVE